MELKKGDWFELPSGEFGTVIDPNPDLRPRSLEVQDPVLCYVSRHDTIDKKPGPIYEQVRFMAYERRSVEALVRKTSIERHNRLHVAEFLENALAIRPKQPKKNNFQKNA
ncbi:hypothetical protein [uncultured Sphaerochaeta sp.]|uniref:hypothetical protein n=1 Tax=uncultured Sphaerochaeta sp. TaxID=886478 RepID=UPI00260A0B3F|nr:hypothetical protein [uncultured Sphaerochaeta sp.]